MSTECTYDGNGRDDYIFFGEETGDEMCFAFMEVFPRPGNKSYTSVFNFDNV